ncbi:MAG TPA: RT0821/Lpp0805 family surface protein [Burkholderiales bacterium]|nr:RT0821/Lpp0805 family surface protein [Burkholderiales bacterium]
MTRISAALVALVSFSLVPMPAPADPPPWAKAHGWRKKNDPSYVGYTGKKWDQDYGVIEGRCDTDKVGAVLGGVVGGVVGAKVSSPENRPVAIVVGTVLGAVIGAKVGRTLDDADRACFGHALELAGEKSTVVWTNPNTGVHYELTPTRNLGDLKNPCREFTTKVSSARASDVVKGVACRRGAGDWVFRS